jgi:hypothetical protein
MFINPINLLKTGYSKLTNRGEEGIVLGYSTPSKSYRTLRLKDLLVVVALMGSCRFFQKDFILVPSLNKSFLSSSSTCDLNIDLESEAIIPSTAIAENIAQNDDPPNSSLTYEEYLTAEESTSVESFIFKQKRLKRLEFVARAPSGP